MSLIFANQVSSAESALSSQGWDGMFAEQGLCLHASPDWAVSLLRCLQPWGRAWISILLFLFLFCFFNCVSPQPP